MRTQRSIAVQVATFLGMFSVKANVNRSENGFWFWRPRFSGRTGRWGSCCFLIYPWRWQAPSAAGLFLTRLLGDPCLQAAERGFCAPRSPQRCSVARTPHPASLRDAAAGPGLAAPSAGAAGSELRGRGCPARAAAHGMPTPSLGAACPGGAQLPCPALPAALQPAQSSPALTVAWLVDRSESLTA